MKSVVDGSTCLVIPVGGTTDANGAKVSEMRYKPWGKVRSWWTASLSTTPAYKLADYTFTGQFSYMDDPSTGSVTEGFGLMFYNARWYDPYLNQFTQPDSIVPDPYNPQDWNRYSYVRNNPLRYTDPSGHMVADEGGGCEYSADICKKNYLYGKSQAIVKSMINDKNRDDLEAMIEIIDLGAVLFPTSDELIPVLSGIFLGIEESNSMTVYNAATGADRCAAVGRSVDDCAANAVRGWFGDEGFHPDFRDNFSQPFHFWAYLATAANTEGRGPASYIPGAVIGMGANEYHERWEPLYDKGIDRGATWQDYALGRAGVNIGTLVNMGMVPPDQLGNTIRDYVGTGGPGAFYVTPLIFLWPLEGNR